MNREILHSQSVQAAQVIAEELQRIDTVEKNFFAKQGSASKKKVLIYLGASFGVIVFTWLLLYAVHNRNLGFAGNDAVLAVTGIAVTAYAGIMAAKVVLNRTYYGLIFGGLELTGKIKEHLTAYQAQLEQRAQKLAGLEAEGWGAKVVCGWDFQTELRSVEAEIRKAEKIQTDFLKPYAFFAFLIASIGVGWIQAGLMQAGLCECVADAFGYEEWIEPLYNACALLGVIGGAVGMAYFWLFCKKKKLTMYTLLWIFADSLIGLAAAFLAAGVILSVVWIIIEIVKFVIKIVVGALVTAGVCFGAASTIRPQNRRRN